MLHSLGPFGGETLGSIALALGLRWCNLRVHVAFLGAFGGATLGFMLASSEQSLRPP